MRVFEFRVATRYLTSSGLQTVLILAGVAMGIVAYTFMAALINGLNVSLTNDVIGNIPHVILEPPDRDPRVLGEPSRRLVAIQRDNAKRAKIEDYKRTSASLRAMKNVVAVSPRVIGNGFFQRGEKSLPVAITGVLTSEVSTIVDFENQLIEGTTQIGPGEVLIGVTLGEELGVSLGQPVNILSDRGKQRSLRVRGIFDVGSANLNERVAYCELRTAQSLLELDGAVSEFAINLEDFRRAPDVAAFLESATGLNARDWVSENKNLQDALSGQATTGRLIKGFSLITIVIGVSSVLLLAAVRRRSEIGILRSMGASRGSIRRIFQLQGFFIGLVGSSVGALGGWLFCRFVETVAKRPDGSQALPIDPALGEYGTAIAFATVAATLASILPSWRAAQVDPIEIIQL